MGVPLSVPTGLQAYWQSRPDLQGLTSDGRLWHRQAKEGTALPFAEFAVVSDVVEGQTTAGQVRRATVQVNCHADSFDGADAVRAAIEPALDSTRGTVGLPPSGR